MKGMEWDKLIHALVVEGVGCLIIRNKMRKTLNIVKGQGSERTFFEILSLL